MTAPYNAKYPGIWPMQWHDAEKSEIKRWFDNWKVERYASFAAEYEWLTIAEVPVQIGRRKGVRYVGEIGADHTTERRKVEFDPSAPPPPTLYQPASKKYEPPKRIISGDRMYDSERRWLMDMMYSRRSLMNPYHYGSPVVGFADGPPREPPKPPPPRYRRN